MILLLLWNIRFSSGPGLFAATTMLLPYFFPLFTTRHCTAGRKMPRSLIKGQFSPLQPPWNEPISSDGSYFWYLGKDMSNCSGINHLRIPGTPKPESGHALCGVFLVQSHKALCHTFSQGTFPNKNFSPPAFFPFRWSLFSRILTSPLWGVRSQWLP